MLSTHPTLKKSTIALKELFSQEPQIIVGETSLFKTIMSPYRLFSSVPTIHLEDDTLKLARDFKSFVLSILKPNPETRPLPRQALTYNFLQLRDQKEGSNAIVYRPV